MVQLVSVALRVTFGFLGLAAIVLSARINATALATIGGPSAAFLASVAYMTAVVKCSVPVYCDYFKHGSRGLLAVFWLAIVFDLLCVLGFTAITRGALSDKAAQAETARKEQASEVERIERTGAAAVARATEAVDRVRTEQKRLQDVAAAMKFAGRTSSAILIGLEAQQIKAGDCKERGHTDACQYVFRLRTELEDARAREANAASLDALERQAREARDAADRQASEARAVLKSLEPSTANPDPQARAMAELFASVGIALPESIAGKAFNFVLVLLVELLAIFGLKAAFIPPTERVEVVQQIAPPALAAAKPVARPTAGAAPPKPDSVRTWLLQATPDSAGLIYSSNRAISRDVGLSVSAVNRELHKLSAAGIIQLHTSGAGTAFKIVGAI